MSERMEMSERLDMSERNIPNVVFKSLKDGSDDGKTIELYNLCVILFDMIQTVHLSKDVYVIRIASERDPNLNCIDDFTYADVSETLELKIQKCPNTVVSEIIDENKIVIKNVKPKDYDVGSVLVINTGYMFEIKKKYCLLVYGDNIIPTVLDSTDRSYLYVKYRCDKLNVDDDIIVNLLLIERYYDSELKIVLNNKQMAPKKKNINNPEKCWVIPGFSHDIEMSYRKAVILPRKRYIADVLLKIDDKQETTLGDINGLDMFNIVPYKRFYKTKLNLLEGIPVLKLNNINAMVDGYLILKYPLFEEYKKLFKNIDKFLEKTKNHNKIRKILKRKYDKLEDTTVDRLLNFSKMPLELLKLLDETDFKGSRADKNEIKSHLQKNNIESKKYVDDIEFSDRIKNYVEKLKSIQCVIKNRFPEIDFKTTNVLKRRIDANGDNVEKRKSVKRTEQNDVYTER